MSKKRAGSADLPFSPEEYISQLYRTLLGREPDDGGLVAHATALRRGGDPTEILRAFVGSDEYQNRNVGMRLSPAIPADVAGAAPALPDDTLSFVLEASRRHFSDPAFLKQLARRDDLFPVRPRPVKTIALYYWRMNNGGTERVTARQALMWSKLGYKVILLTDQERQEDDDYDYGEVTRYVLPERMMHNQDYIRRGRALADILQLEDVDLFVTNQWYEISSVWDVLTAKSLGIPSIIGWHNVYDAGIHGVDDLGLANLRYLGYHHADLIAVLSSVDQLWFESWKTPALMVHNPLTFDVMPKRAPLDGHTILWLARAERHQKRIDHVLRMFPLVLAQVPDARLLIVGGGPDLEWAREYAHALGVGSRVHFAGYTTEVDKFIDRASVHVMTSEFEGYPMVLGEVWSHGVPTVMYDLPHLEYLRSGRGHIAVEQRNVEQLAAGVTRVLRDAALRRTLGQQARTVVEEIVATGVDSAWQGIFDQIGRGQVPTAPAVSQQHELDSMRILVGMLRDKMMSLYGPNNTEELQPYLPSHAPVQAPQRQSTKRLVKAARIAAAPYAVAQKSLSRPATPDASALKMINLSNVGLGDNLMIWAGLYTLLDNGVPLCAPRCVIHVQPILADLCSRIFARFGLVVQRGAPAKQLSPIYSPLPPTTFKEWRGTYFGHDWRMNWVEAIDLQKSFPRHGADRSFRARIRLFMSERFLYKRSSWTDATPSYIGFRVWQPLAAKHGIYPTQFLSQLKQSLQGIRRTVAAYVDEMTPVAERAAYTAPAAFPAGKSFQTISPQAYKQIDQDLGGDYFTCYVQEDSPWHEDFNKNGVATKHLKDIKDTFRVIKYSRHLLTTDSFTSHLAQFLRDDFVLVLSRDMQESIVHPGSNPRIVANHPPCAPCNYQERYHFDLCVAGYNYCIAFESRAFIDNIARCFVPDRVT